LASWSKTNNQRQLSSVQIIYTPSTRSSWLDELVRQAGYMLAGRASSMFARCLLDVCLTFAPNCSMSARCLLDRVNWVLCMLHFCSMFAGRLLEVCSMSARSCKRGITSTSLCTRL